MRTRRTAAGATRKPKPRAAGSDPAGDVADGGGGRARDFLLALLVATSVVLAYAGVRHHGFVNFDDPAYVLENPQVQNGFTLESLTWAFTAFHSANWHPLTWLSHMLDWRLFDSEAGGHHMASVVLHALASVGLFGALRTMTLSPWRSAFVAALFALHPRNVESVAWVSERKDVLSALLWTSAMWAYAWYVRRPALGRYLVVAGLFAAGLLAKPMVVTLPAALLLLDVWPLGRTPWVPAFARALPRPALRSLLLEKVPLLALAAAASVLTLRAQSRSHAVASLETVPIAARVENAVVAYATYLGKTIWPSDLAVFYPYRLPVPPREVLLSLLVLLVISALAIAQVRRRPYLLVGWLWYLGTLLPVIGLVMVGDQAMADRFTYLPLIGIYVAVTWAVSDAVARSPLPRRMLAAVGIAILLALALATRAQVAVWRDGATLFRHALAATERNHVAEANLSAALLVQGRPAEAVEHARAAVSLRPGDPRVHVNLGAALAQLGRKEEARAAYEEALRLDPGSAMAHVDLALLLSEQERWEEAEREFGAVLRIDPRHAKGHAGLGWVLARQGRTENAIEHFRAAIAADAGLVAAYNSLALALEELGHVDEALEMWDRALQIDPDDPRLRENRAAALAEARGADEAPAGR